MGVSATLDIGKSALLAQRTALDVTGHNIANADTEGYSRQTAVFTARDAYPLGGVMLPTGVDLKAVTRSYNSFATKNIDGQTSTLGTLDARQEYLGVLETLLSDSGDGGLSTRLSAFFAGFQDLANNPSGSAERQALLQQGSQLTDQFNSTRASLDNLSLELHSRVTDTVSSINLQLAQVAKLNNAIVGAQAGGAEANDMCDSRDLLLHQLSQEVGANYYENPDGHVSVLIGDHLMVDGTSANTLSTTSTGPNSVGITWNGANGAQDDVTSRISGGTLGGYIQLTNETLPGYRTQLDDMAKSIIYEVNSVHSQGVGRTAATAMTGSEQTTSATAAMATAASGLNFYDRIDNSGTASFKVHVYDAAGAPLSAGGTSITITAGMSLNNLASALDAVTGISATVSGGKLSISAASGEGGAGFAVSDDTSGVLAALGLNSFFSGHDAATMGVAVTADQIAAGKVGAGSTFGSGDGSNALAIANLEDTSVDIGGTQQSFSQGLAALVSTVGVESAGVQRDQTFQKSLLDQLSAQRDSQTGVSLDEELTNMLKYQRAYQAAAKLIKTADDMLATLMEVK